MSDINKHKPIINITLVHICLHYVNSISKILNLKKYTDDCVWVFYIACNPEYLKQVTMLFSDIYIKFHFNYGNMYKHTCIYNFA